MVDPCLCDRTVLITGANNPFGIGAAAAVAFARQGARLFLHYFRAADQDVAATDVPSESFYRVQQTMSCDDLAARLAATGTEVYAFEADFANPMAPAELFDAAESALGRVEVLVNNAATLVSDTFVPPGAPPQNPLVELWTTTTPFSQQTFARLMSVNAAGPALLMREFANRHVRRGGDWGRIVNVSTDAAACFPSQVSYGASKLARESLTRSAASELGRYRPWGWANVNVILLVDDTPWHQSGQRRESLYLFCTCSWPFDGIDGIHTCIAVSCCRTRVGLSEGR